MDTNEKIINVLILGASFDTGNLGVAALAWSTINLLREDFKNSEISLLGGRKITSHNMVVDGQETEIFSYPVRYCRNLLAENHIWKLFAGVLFARVISSKLLLFSKKRNQTLQALLQADMICDITGGDSFSDIYGMGRFLRGYLLKRVCQMTGKPFVMLPQTYGPFKSPLTRLLAKRILRKAARIYSRDREGLEVVEKLIGKSDKVRLCPDVAFTLEPRAPVFSCQSSVIRRINSSQLSEANSQNNTNKNSKLQTTNYQLNTNNSKLTTNNCQLVGLNISGLLYNGGYTGNNEFGLKVDYPRLMREIIEYFTSLENTYILLAAHVVSQDWETEDDLRACRKVRESLPEAVRQKVMIVETDDKGNYFDQCEIKYLIGQCDFFLGSRMHATIAAISLGIPTVGLAYSRKFAGVYETAGVEDCAMDLCAEGNAQILNHVKRIFDRRTVIQERLKVKHPKIKTCIHAIFD